MTKNNRQSYQKDFYVWTLFNRRNPVAAIDIGYAAEKIASLEKNEKSELANLWMESPRLIQEMVRQVAQAYKATRLMAKLAADQVFSKPSLFSLQKGLDPKFPLHQYQAA
jgi:hypothetical protein